MAWTEITYACGHTGRVQMYGPGLQRDARVFAYRQKPCEECRKARWRAERPEYIRPRFEIHNAGPGAARITVHDTYDCWRELAARSYRLESRDEGGEWDRVEPWREYEVRERKAYVRDFDSPEALKAEIEWLALIEAERIEPSKPEQHPLPRAFAQFEDDWGLAFSQKVAVTCHTIRLALARAKQPYVAFSGGKDSTVALALVHAVAPDIPAIWTDHELEFPETVEYMELMRARLGDRLIAIEGGTGSHPGWHVAWRDEPFWRERFPEAIIKHLPTGAWAKAAGYDLTILGLRGDESKVRAAMLTEVGPTYRRRDGLVCCPLWDWNFDDVWRFLRSTSTPYNRIYDRYEELGLPPELRRLAALYLSPRDTLARGWPELLARLEARYGPRWGD